MKRRTRRFWLGWMIALVLTPQVGLGGRCATGLRGDKPDPFEPLRPALRRAAARVAVPVEVDGAHSLTTEHFRLLWGDRYDRADTDWADPDGDGIPTWVETLGDALERALVLQRSLGFPEPFGSADYLLDVYVGNTGLTVDGRRITVSQDYYAYTEIDRGSGVAYFVVNDDFSAHTADELGVLRATAAHELFHAVQAADYPWDDEVAIPDARWEREGWWFEATATWMEEECEPEVDDYAAYVRGFLARPELPLTSTDGLREYGAAIFPGYLRLWAGGPAVWQETFRSAYEAGVESSLDGALRRRGSPGLAHAVASFWSLAAHPEDGWPDGAAFRGAASPRLLRSASAYPFEATASGATAPGRFGANLYRLPPAAAPLPVRLVPLLSASPHFLLASSGPDDGGLRAPRVQPVPQDGLEVFLEAAGPAEVYLAAVNASETEGVCSYRLEVAGTTPEVAGEDGEAGGCFLQALR